MADSIECNSIECNSAETLNIDNQSFRLNKINEIKDYFIAEIKERELMSKKLSKYIAFCYYSDKVLVVLSATSVSISIASFATVIGTPVGIASASLSLAFSLSTGLVKKLNSIESKLSEALMNNRISHEESMPIINEQINYRELKESIRMIKVQEDKKIDID